MTSPLNAALEQTTSSCERATSLFLALLNRRASEAGSRSDELQQLIYKLQLLHTSTLNSEPVAYFEATLPQCVQACRDFESMFHRTAQLAGTESNSAWAKLKYGDDCSALRPTAAAYRKTMSIALSIANDFVTPAGHNSLKPYDEMIVDISSDLEICLGDLNHSLNALSTLEQEKGFIFQCLEVCRSATIQLKELRKEHAQNLEHSMTDECRCTHAHEKLHETKEFQYPSKHHGIIPHSARLHRLNKLKNISVSEDGCEVMVSTYGHPIAAEDIEVKARATHVYGQMSDATIQHIITNRSSIVTQDNHGNSATSPEFNNRYSIGRDLHSTEPPGSVCVNGC